MSASYEMKAFNASYELNPNLSLYIPHVFPNFTEEYIANIFQNLNLGYVDHVDLVSKQDRFGKNYNAAYVHFAEWFAGPATEHFQERVVNPNKEARIIHDDPWFWIVLENKAKKYEPGARKPIINLEPTPDVSMIEIAPQMQDEIDALIAEHFNEPIDASCEFLEDELRTENEKLRSTIAKNMLHANDCHTKMAQLTLENNKLHNKIADLTLALQAMELELDEARQENFDKEQELDEVRQENFLLEELTNEE
jgi:hypothetical protein